VEGEPGEHVVAVDEGALDGDVGEDLAQAPQAGQALVGVVRPAEGPDEGDVVVEHPAQRVEVPGPPGVEVGGDGAADVGGGREGHGGALPDPAAANARGACT
jgi:hypothetical protein